MDIHYLFSQTVAFVQINPYFLHANSKVNYPSFQIYFAALFAHLTTFSRAPL